MFEKTQPIHQFTGKFLRDPYQNFIRTKQTILDPSQFNNNIISTRQKKHFNNKNERAI